MLAKNSSSGELYISMARHYLEKHEWGQAIKAAEEALKKGQLTEPDQAHALIQEVYQLTGIRRRNLSQPQGT